MASTDSLPSYLIGAREGKKAQEEFIRQETGHPSFQSMIGKFDDTFNIQVSCEEKSGGMEFEEAWRGLREEERVGDCDREEGGWMERRMEGEEALW
jgi:hypothetical protein